MVFKVILRKLYGKCVKIITDPTIVTVGSAAGGAALGAHFARRDSKDFNEKQIELLQKQLEAMRENKREVQVLSEKFDNFNTFIDQLKTGLSEVNTHNCNTGEVVITGDITDNQANAIDTAINTINNS
jgi:ABC-type phosphate transport system auxiliary subunit